MGNNAAVVRASPVPQDMVSAASSTAPSSLQSTISEGSVSPTTSGIDDTDNTSDVEDRPSGNGMSGRQVYYILAIGACAVGVLAFVVTYVYRKRRQRRQAALAGARDEGSAHYNGHRAQPHQRQRKERIVLSQEQFDMLPRIIAQCALSADAKNNDSDASSADDDAKCVEDGDNLKKPAAVAGALNEAESCSICLSDIVRGEELVALVPCNHQFHIDCVSRWLTQKSTKCPLCKADMLEGLGFTRPKSIGEDNDDIELVTIPANPDSTLTNSPSTETRPETMVELAPSPAPPSPAAIVERRRSLARS
ncbi:hypothetical protein GGF43_000658 [Coemansia sp. RSA 2618]|nr:hypothetical protein GGF43_000658 [Coemansia sp. RSA 2618]